MKRQLIFALFVVLSANALLGQSVFDGGRALDIVSYLASDDFKGRKSGTPEYLKAARYVADNMRKFGLEPGGDDNSYFQEAVFKNWYIFEQPLRFEITSPQKRAYFAGRDRDFLPVRGTGAGTVRGELVFAGYGIIAEEFKWNDYAHIDVKNKIAILMPGAPDSLGSEVRREWNLDKKIETLAEKGAVGAVVMNLPAASGSRRRGSRLDMDSRPENFVVMSANTVLLDDIFYLSNQSWRFLVSKTLREMRSYTASLEVTLEMEAHYTHIDSLTAPNVLGVLPGIHPELKNEYIILGGHLDHLGIAESGFVLNGADDNAASAAVLLEIARAMQYHKFKPDRTIIFASWAGEEMGLVGSRYYVNNPIYPLEKTVVYMNMDMIGCGDADFYVGGMYEFSDFYDFIKDNLEKKFVDKLHYRLNYRGSDHSAFLPKGVTCISLRNGNVLTRELDDEHPEYHRPGDAPNIIEPEVLELVAEYHYDILELLSTTKKDLLDPVYHRHFVHKDATVVDLHCDTISRFIQGEDLSADLPSGHIDIPKLKEGSVDLQVFACYVAPPSDEKEKYRAANKAFVQIDGIYRLAEENPDEIIIVRNNGEAGAVRGTRKTGIIIGIEGGYAIENDLALLRSFYRAGVRLMTLTHWTRTDWADASGDETALFGGLTEFGEQVVGEMNELGMIIDVSHVHDETFWDVMEISEHPVVASHSCCRALSEHHRNLSDSMLVALAENGGVIGINYAPGFLNAEFEKTQQALFAELAAKHGLPADYRELQKADPDKVEKFWGEFLAEFEVVKSKMPPVDVKTVVDHIDHVVEVTGNADFVGLGSDFDGISSTPIGLENVSKLPAITDELLARGYSDADVKKILGGNFLRVFRRVCR